MNARMRVFLILSWLISQTIAQGIEVPTKKAERPKMSPKIQMPKVTDQVYFDIEVDNQKSGRIIIGLFGDTAPLTVENFKRLCACDHGKGKLSGINLCYKNTVIHRIIPNFMVQGGDVTHNSGIGGESIYGGKFHDETFEVPHNKRYLISMANAGPNTNGSQFFINTVKVSWLDGKNVAFGVVTGGTEVIDELEALGTNSGTPRGKVVIVDSGILKE